MPFHKGNDEFAFKPQILCHVESMDLTGNQARCQLAVLQVHVAA